MNWQSQCALSVFQQRAFLLAEIRNFFHKKKVLEVETPILSSSGNTDTNIDSFTSNQLTSDHPVSYLRTSPEFPLKRLLCSGIGDVYEMGKVFRRGEFSRTHNCEFTLLEWYRLNFTYKDLIQEVSELFGYLMQSFQHTIPISKTITFQQCFKTHLDIDAFNCTVTYLNETCEIHGYSGSLLSRDEAFDFLFATQIQPKLNANCLTFVTLYPASQAVLAEINPNDNRTALRFEVFYKGHELGNGYQELTDANELEDRFCKDNLVRKNNNKTTIRMDGNLLHATRNGMPNCSGIAMGVDRLLMVLLSSESIVDVISFNAKNS